MSSVLSVPMRLRMASTAFLLCIPLAALETILIDRAPWWHLPYDKIVLWSTSVALMSVPMAGWVSRGYRWAFPLKVVFSAAWVALSAWVSFRMKSPVLGFFTLGQLFFFVIVLGWIRRETRRSFFDPELRWFEGAPRPLPGIRCEVALGDHREEFQVSRLDRNGAFVFQPEASLSGSGHDTDAIEAFIQGSTRAGERPQLVFRFREMEVKAQGQPIRLLGRGSGAGFQFEGMSSDAKKELGDFIEILRGEGYV